MYTQLEGSFHGAEMEGKKQNFESSFRENKYTVQLTVKPTLFFSQQLIFSCEISL